MDNNTISTGYSPSQIDKYQEARLEEQRRRKLEENNERADAFALALSPDFDMDKVDVGSLIQLENRTTGLNLSDADDYWALENVKEEFQGDRSAFNKTYDKAKKLFYLSEAVSQDLSMLLDVTEAPDSNRRKGSSALHDAAANGIMLSPFTIGGHAYESNPLSHVRSDRERVLTNKKVAQLVGVKNDDGSFDRSPGMLQQMFTTDFWRVAKDEEGYNKMTLNGAFYIERAKGSQDVKSYDELVNIFSSGALEDTWFDGNVIDQSWYKVLARQIHKFTPYTRVAVFASAAASGVAELVKSVSGAVSGDGYDNGTYRAMNYFQNYLKRYDMDMDERSKESFWNINNIINGIGEIGPQVLGMKAIAKLPTLIAGLKVAKQEGFKGLEILSKAYKTAMGVKGGLNLTPEVQKRSAVIGSILSRGGMSAMATEDFAREAREGGLTPNEALLMHVGFTAFMYFGPSKFTDRIGTEVDDMYGRAAKAKFNKMFVKALTKSGKRADPSTPIKLGERMGRMFSSSLDHLTKLYNSSGKDGVVGYLGAGLNEFLEEVTEYSGETAMKWMYNDLYADNVYGKDRESNMFDVPTLGEFFEEALFSGVMGFIGGGIGRASMKIEGRHTAWQNKVMRFGKGEVIDTFVNDLLDPQRRMDRDKEFENYKQGSFMSTELSFAKDADGNFKPVNPKSVDPLENTSQDALAKHAYHTMWETSKELYDSIMKKNGVTKGKDGKITNWTESTRQAVGEDFSILFTDVLSDMAENVSKVFNAKVELRDVETEETTSKDTIPSDKEVISEKKKDLKNEITQAEERIADIIQGRVANHHFSKAVFELDPTVNVTKDGKKIDPGQPGYVTYERFKDYKDKKLQQAKSLLEEDKEFKESNAKIDSQIDQAQDLQSLYNIVENYEGKLSPEVVSKMKKKMIVFFDSDPDAVQELREVMEESIDRNLELVPTDNITDPEELATVEERNKAIHKTREELKAAINDPSLTTHSILLNATEEFFPDASDPVHNFDFSTSKRGSEIEQMINSNITTYESPFIDFTSGDAFDVTEALLKAESEDEVFDVLKSDKSKFFITDFDAISNHLSSIIKDDPDYDPANPTQGGLGKNQKLERLSSKLRSHIKMGERYQAISAALDADDTAGGKSYTKQIYDEVHSFKSNPEGYNTPIEYLDDMMKNLIEQRSLLQGLLNVDALSAKFQAVNKDKFDFKEQIDNILGPDILDKYHRIITDDGKMSKEEMENLNKEFMDEVETVSQMLFSYSLKSSKNIKVLEMLIQQVKYKSNNSTEGIQKKDMEHMDGDIAKLFDISSIIGSVNEAYNDLLYGEDPDDLGVIPALTEAEGSTDYRHKRLLIKTAEIKLNKILTSIPKSKVQELVNSVNYSTPQERYVVFYMLQLSRKSFEGAHEKYQDAIKNFESSPTYEQETAAIAAYTKMMEVDPITHIMMNEEFDDMIKVIGRAGTGKTTYVASVVANMMNASGHVVAVTPLKEQRVNLEKSLKMKGIDIINETDPSTNNFDVDNLIKALEADSDYLQEAKVIIMDESTNFPLETMAKLGRTLKLFNEIRAKKGENTQPLRVVAMGDSNQIGYYSVDNNSVKISNIGGSINVESTRELKTSQRVGPMPNSQLAEYFVEIGNSTQAYTHPASLELNYAVEDNVDRGVRIEKDRKAFMDEVEARATRAKAEGTELIYITDRPEIDNERLKSLGVKVKSINEVHGGEFDQVVIDMDPSTYSFRKSGDYVYNKVTFTILYTALTRAKSGLLMNDNFGHNIKTTEGTVHLIKSTLDPSQYETFKEERSEVVQEVVELERRLYDSVVGSGELKVGDLTDNDMMHTNEAYGKAVINAYLEYLKREGKTESTDLDKKNFKNLFDSDFSTAVDEITSLDQSDKKSVTDKFREHRTTSPILTLFSEKILADMMNVEIHVPVTMPEVSDELIGDILSTTYSDSNLSTQVADLLSEINDLVKSQKC